VTPASSQMHEDQLSGRFKALRSARMREVWYPDCRFVYSARRRWLALPCNIYGHQIALHSNVGTLASATGEREKKGVTVNFT
jgi:hypothetical protein